MKYTPYYCEENIWHLAAERRAAGLPSIVALITNEHRSCALWSQKAALPDEPIAWDYHVILLAPVEQGAEGRFEVWDLDSRVGAPAAFDVHAARTFAAPGAIPARFEPRFRIMAGDEYVSGFSSDRSHMRTKNGRYRKPPPAWPPIVGPSSATASATASDRPEDPAAEHPAGPAGAARPRFLAWLDEGSPGPGRWLGLVEFLWEFG